MAKMKMLSVYDDDGAVVGKVRAIRNLDSWNGSEWCYRFTGEHRGITRLRDGRFVLIHSSDWFWMQEYANYAYVISEAEALLEIMKAHKNKLLERYFSELLDSDEGSEVSRGTLRGMQEWCRSC